MLGLVHWAPMWGEPDDRYPGLEAAVLEVVRSQRFIGGRTT